MPTIRDYVKTNLGETYDKLTDVALYDGSSKPDAVGIKISALLDRFNIDEDDIGDYAKSYIADWVSIEIIPLAIDYYMVNTRLVDNASRPSGVTPFGGEVGTNYNRIHALELMSRFIQGRLNAGRSAFDASLPVSAKHNLAPAGIYTSKHTRPLRTQDPWDTFDKPSGVLYPYAVGYGVATAYVVEVDESWVGVSGAL